jgi:hypothetical protein
MGGEGCAPGEENADHEQGGAETAGHGVILRRATNQKS